MKKLGVIIVTVLLLGNIAIFSQPEMGNIRGNRVKKALKLTPDQEKKFDDLKYQQQQGAIDIRAKIQKNRLELKKIIGSGAIDEKKVLQLTEENSKLQGDLKYSAVRSGLDIYKILNDDQKALWSKFISGMSDGRMKRGKMRGDARNIMQNRAMRNNPGMMNNRGMRDNRVMRNNMGAPKPEMEKDIKR